MKGVILIKIFILCIIVGNPCTQLYGEEEPTPQDISLGTGRIRGTTATIDFTNFDVTGAGDLRAVTIDLGTGPDNDLQADDIRGLTNGGSTTLHSHPALVGIKHIITLDSAYDNDTAGNAEITVDARHVSLNLNDATNDYRVQIDNTTTGTIDDGLIFLTSGVGSVFTDGIDLSALTATENAVNLGTNDIEGTTATLTFTDFEVTNDGLISLFPDSAGDGMTITIPAAATQALVIDASTNASTDANGIIDLNVNTLTADAEAMDISVHGNDGAATGADIIGVNMTLTQNDADSDMFGIKITAASTANAISGSYDAGIAIDQNDNTANAMTDGIIITSSGVDGGITDGIDVSHTNITTALSMSSLTLLGTTATIDFTDFDVSDDGLVTLGPDGAGDALKINLPAAASQAIVISAALSSTDTVGIFDLNVNSLTTNASAMDISMAGSNGTALGANIIGINMTLTQDDGDADMFGIKITAENTLNAGAGSYEAAITIDNLDATAGSMPDAIIITSSGVADGVTDAIDASAANITNALNVGANVISATTGMTLDCSDAADCTVTLTNTGTGTTTILDFTSEGHDLRIPSASPANNALGLYRSTLNICLDDVTDVCVTLAMATSTHELNSKYVEMKERVFHDPKTIQALDRLTHSKELIEFTKDKTSLSDLTKLGQTYQKLQKNGPVSSLQQVFSEMPDAHQKGSSYFEISGESKLMDGVVSVKVPSHFLEKVEVDEGTPFWVQVIPLSLDIQGILTVIAQGKDYFVVEEREGKLQGKSNALFSWKVSARRKESE